MFNWIFSDTQQYLEPFNFFGLCEIELLESELFNHLMVYVQNVFTNHKVNIYVKTGWGFK